MSHVSSRRLPLSTALLLALVIVLAVILCIVATRRFLPAFALAKISQTVTDDAAESETASASLTVVDADGNSESVLCLDSYTVSAEDAEDAADDVVARWDGEKLTNAELQLYYLNAVRTYQASGSETQPDYTLPLDEQRCPLEEGYSWQHYFLKQAVEDWQTIQILLAAAEEPRPITEEAYKPNETDDLHGKYVADDLPVNNFLYQDLDCYTPNSMHQEYLDGLEEQMEALAEELGYSSLEACAEALFGGLVSAEDMVQAAYDYNFGYMYFTEESYEVTVTDEDIEEYESGHKRELEDGYTVDIRQILLIPDGAVVTKNGTVIAADEQWEKCKQEAEQLLNTWKTAYLTTLSEEANFARIANANSEDAGSQINGGSYCAISSGQLISELDEWCFDEEREEGDTAVIRSAVGYHIVYFCGKQSKADTAAQEALAKQQLLDDIEARREDGTLKLTYDNAALWVDVSAPAVSAVDVLYPDIAHERFPEAIVYFQQDYMYSPYGSSYVGRGGCGITTMAMLATYMTDTILTPDMLASRYSQYHDASGTKGELFRYTPEEMGFYLEKTTANIDEVIAALENGQRVISLQYQGHFTSGGHYLLLQQYYEEDDTFQVRDSNIYNYGKLEGHKIDKFTRANILSGGNIFYIMQKKITRIPACTRCGDTFDETAPKKLFNEDYLCEKCTAALNRRNAYLELMGSVSE